MIAPELSDEQCAAIHQQVRDDFRILWGHLNTVEHFNALIRAGYRAAPWAAAERKLRSIGANGRVIGSDPIRIPVAPHWLVRAVQRFWGLKNAKARRKIRSNGTRASQCGSKQKFDNESAAAAAAHRPWRKLSRAGFMSAYRCRFCKGWHYGHPRADQMPVHR